MFQYDGSIPNDDGLLTGMELLSGHIGGTRRSPLSRGLFGLCFSSLVRSYCVPCYTLAGKFGSPPLHKSMVQKTAHASTTANAQPNKKPAPAASGALTMDALQKQLKKRQATPQQNSTCGALACLPGLDTIGVGFDVLSGELRDLVRRCWASGVGRLLTLARSLSA